MIDCNWNKHQNLVWFNNLITWKMSSIKSIDLINYSKNWIRKFKIILDEILIERISWPLSLNRSHKLSFHINKLKLEFYLSYFYFCLTCNSNKIATWSDGTYWLGMLELCLYLSSLNGTTFFISNEFLS